MRLHAPGLLLLLLTAPAPPRRIGAVYSPETLCVAIARLGRDDQRIVCATLAQMAAGCEGLDLGPPLHSLVLVGDTHPVEDELLDAMFRWRPAGDAAAAPS
jgi:diphthamide biosynthesis methyltransferase